MIEWSFTHVLRTMCKGSYFVAAKEFEFNEPSVVVSIFHCHWTYSRYFVAGLRLFYFFCIEFFTNSLFFFCILVKPALDEIPKD